MTDRIAGLFGVVLSGAYLWLAAGYTTSFGDPLGPAMFPRVIGIPALILSLALAIWPGHHATWAGRAGLARQAAAIAILLGYALLLEPLGFVLSTMLALLGMGRLMDARWWQAAAVAVVSAPFLYLLFDWFLGLPLPLLGDWIS